MDNLKITQIIRQIRNHNKLALKRVVRQTMLIKASLSIGIVKEVLIHHYIKPRHSSSSGDYIRLLKKNNHTEHFALGRENKLSTAVRLSLDTNRAPMGKQNSS